MAAVSYDPTLKELVEMEPEAWPALFGGPTGPTSVIDADIATVSGAADKVLRVTAEPPYLLHLEFVSGHDVAALPCRLHMHNGLLEYKHGVCVRSGVVLLRPGADSPQLTGVYERGFPSEAMYLTFRYHVLRVWRLPPRPLLTGALALLPLAPISAVTEDQLPGIIEQMKRRLSSRGGRRRAGLVWAAAYILFGLSRSPQLAAQLFRGVVTMKESSTYQAILEEGRVEGRVEGRMEGRSEGAMAEAKKVLRLLGDDVFGPPNTQTVAIIEALSDLGQLESLLKRVRTAGSWQELLAKPRGRRNGHRQ